MGEGRNERIGVSQGVGAAGGVAGVSVGPGGEELRALEVSLGQAPAEVKMAAAWIATKWVRETVVSEATSLAAR